MITDALSSPPLRVPKPSLHVLENHTPLPCFHAQKMGPGRTFRDTVVVKATFSLTPDRLALSRPDPIVLADHPRDPARATRSSLLHAGEVQWGKPSTDVIVTGSAHAPSREPTPEWLCEVAVSDQGATLARHATHVTGPRWFSHAALRGWTASRPLPARAVPIHYELAHGGAYTRDDGVTVVHKENPSGLGVADERRLDPARRYPAPQWQLPDEPVTSWNQPVGLAGFGPIARSWQGRLRHAGTYDAAWKAAVRRDVARGEVPDYAADFDPRFFQCAHPSLVTARPLRGGETLVLRGMVEGRAELSTTLPRWKLVVGELDERGFRYAPMALDTVHVDLDAAKVWICWRHRFEAETQGGIIFMEGGVDG